MQRQIDDFRDARRILEPQTVVPRKTGREFRGRPGVDRRHTRRRRWTEMISALELVYVLPRHRIPCAFARARWCSLAAFAFAIVPWCGHVTSFLTAAPLPAGIVAQPRSCGPPPSRLRRCRSEPT